LVAIMNIHTIKKSVLLLAVFSLLLACVVPTLPTTVSPNPTAAPGSLQTIVVATAGAAQTQTARVLPSPTVTSTATLAPSSTPTDTATATATIIFVIPSATLPPTATREIVPTQTAGAGCQLVSQRPADGSSYGGGERFNVEWTIRNTSSDSWQSSSVDFFHSGGRDMHGSDIIDLPNNVRSGDQVTLSVNMRAPENSGTYTSEWTLGTQNNPLCRVSVRIVVR
jgi:hypothetical protein